MENNELKNSPVTAFDLARREYFERFGASIVTGNRMFFVVIFLLVVIIGLAVSIMMIMPLKTVQPYIIRVNGDGAPVAAPVAIEKMQLNDSEKKYFLADWSVKLLTLDKYLTTKNLIEDYGRVKDKAASEFADYVTDAKPAEALKLDPQLTRAVKVRSVSFVSDGAALVRVSTETRSGNGQGVVMKNLILTLHYTLIPPVTEQEIYTNPIGLYVTHFSLSEDLN